MKVLLQLFKMSSKFYIYASGRWREVEMDTGCVSGWGRPSFVYVRGGRLVVAQRRRVLRALRSLAAGRVSAANDSFVLSKYVPSQTPTLKIQCKSHVHQDQKMTKSVDRVCALCNYERFNKLLKETSSVATQCTSTADAGNQVSDTMVSPQPSTNNNNSPKILPLRRKGKFIKTKSRNVNKSRQRDDRETAETNMTKEHATKTLANKDNVYKKQELTQNTKKHRQEVKELLIEEDVVEILRRYLKKNNLGVDSKRYDIDDAYKEQVFYKINPLVVVEQCPQIKTMLESRRANDISEKEFMTSLGLQTTEERASTKRYRNQSTSQSSTQSLIQDNKENELQNTRSLRKRTKCSKDSEFKKYKSSEKNNKQLRPQKMREVVLLSSNSDSDFRDSQLSQKLHVGPRVNGLRVTSSPAKAPIEASKPTSTKAPTGARTSGTTAPGTKSVGAKRVSGWESRVYSPLEDQAIISWVQLGGRARLVNGNRLWRELQPHHLATTGVSRSWHSLRNRYLRYILPTLSNLAPTPVAVHLRAAAATGEIKNRKQKKPVNNSMFAMPRVRSAFAPRRARLASSHTPSPPASPPRTPSPVKRKAMATSTSTASPSPSPTPSPVPTGSSTPTEVQLQKIHNVSERSRLSKRYSELRRRFKDVEESSDEAPRVLRPRPSQAPRRSMHDSSRVLRQEPKKRRLYNPEVI